MEKIVDEIKEELLKLDSNPEETRLPLELDSNPEETRFTKIAREITDIACRNFKGALFDKAVAIAKAIVEFDEELWGGNEPRES